MNKPTGHGNDHSEFYWSKPKYSVGDRLTVMKHVEIEIIYVVESYQIAYMFQIVNAPSLKSVITETELTKIITA